MDEVRTMTVPPALPGKTQSRDASAPAARQTVSIRQSASPPGSTALASGAGATVFVGVGAPAGSDSARPREERRIPEVRFSNGYGKESDGQSRQHQRLHQQRQQQAAHVVKIKINPDGDRNGRVISTVRLTLPEDEIEKGRIVACERSTKNGATNIVNERVRGSSAVLGVERALGGVGGGRSGASSGGFVSGETRVRISVGAVDRSQEREKIKLELGGIECRCDDVDSAIVANEIENEIDGGGGSGSRAVPIGDPTDCDMVQRVVNESPNGCFYYGSYRSGTMTSSGQCSPSETLDSGTCSDLDGTPPPLPKKKSAMAVGSVVIGVATPATDAATVPLSMGQGGRDDGGSGPAGGSLTSSGAELDSDDNESNISCDSLNAGGGGVNGVVREARSKVDDLLILATTTTTTTTTAGKVEVKDESALERNDEETKTGSTTTASMAMNERPEEKEEEEEEEGRTSMDVSSRRRSTSASPSASGASSLSKASSTPRARTPVNSELRGSLEDEAASPVVTESTYEDRKQEQERIEQECAAANFYANYNRSNGTRYVYDDDRFYKFHVNELRRSSADREDAAKDARNDGVLGVKETDECFAGYKILEREAIRSAKGTVRGVKNRVRAGIATFLQKPSSKAYKAKEADKVVVYTTSSGIVRLTFYNCMKVKQILNTHLVKYDERDLFRSAELQTELRDRIGCTAIEVPQLFIGGQFIGNADTVERLNESGELRRMLEPYKSDGACPSCLFCGNYRLLVCPVCNGSKRSVLRNDFTVEFVALKCMNCDETGLVPCRHC